MKALCPKCGFHHDVARVLEDESGESGREVYQVAPNGECQQTWINEQDLFDASARFGQEAIIDDDDDR